MPTADEALFFDTSDHGNCFECMAHMEEFASETDSDYTSYWRDWVSDISAFSIPSAISSAS